MKITITLSLIIVVHIILFGEAESGSYNLCNGWDCRDGTCAYAADGDERCDGIAQCSDGSDEARCDDCSGFPCDDGVCTTVSSVRCDGTDDCADGSDEANCGISRLDLVIIVVVVLVIIFVCCPLAVVILVICCVCIFATNRRKLKLTRKTIATKSDTISTTKFETPYSLLPLEDDSNQKNQADSQSQADKNIPQQSESNTDSTDPLISALASHDQQQHAQSHVDTDSSDSVGDQQPLITSDPAKPADGGQEQPPVPTGS